MDHDFKLPYITVLTGKHENPPELVYRDISYYDFGDDTDSFDGDCSSGPFLAILMTITKRHFSDFHDDDHEETLLSFLKSDQLSLTELSGNSTFLSKEQRKRYINQTTLENLYGKWSVTITPDLYMGATLALSGTEVIMRLPRKDDSSIHWYLWPYDALYRLVFHSEPYFLNSDYSREVYIDGVKSNLQSIELSIDRLIKLNLKRDPCEKDPAYDINACQYNCFSKWIFCSLYGNGPDGKPVCMKSDYDLYKKLYSKFFNQLPVPLNYSAKLGESYSEKEYGSTIDNCGCPQPCIRDTIGYKYISTPVKSDSAMLKMRITIGRGRRTTEMVLTYGLEDLLADAGGYLGLLLGASLLSVFGSGRKLTTRLVRQALAKRRRRRRRRQAAQRGGGTKRHRDSLELQQRRASAR